MNNFDKTRIQAQSLGFIDTVQAMIGKSCIVDFGVIKDIPIKGVVTVGISVAKKPNDIKVITCIYANITSSACTLNVIPTVGDKVVIFYPRKYNANMFSPDKTDVIIDSYATGYDLQSGIAVPLSQYRSASHKNIIEFEDGAITAKLGYNKDDNKNHLLFSTTKKGAVSVSNDKASISVGDDGAIAVDNGGATITIDTSGNVAINAGTGKVKIENSVGSLYSILSSLISNISSLVTVGSATTQALNPATITALTTNSTNLGLVME